MPIANSDARSMRLSELAASIPGAQLLGRGEIEISEIEYDSRRIVPGCLFVALVGGYDDGHAFAADAVARGATALLAERPLDVDCPQILVSNTRASLADAAAAFYEDPSRELAVIGITGTDGKTTTSYLVETMFRNAGVKTGLIGTVAVRVGEEIVEAETRQTTPESLDVQRHLRNMVDQGVRVAIIEATSHGLDLHRLDRTRFVTGAVTNITHEHLEHHKTIAAYRRAKAILFERVASLGGTAVVNADDEGARSVLPFAVGARVLTYSASGVEADFQASRIALSVDRTAFDLRAGGQVHRVETGLVGRFNVENALCALGVASAHDISLETTLATLQQPPPIPGRMQPIAADQPFAVIVDYAHTPDSIEKVLRLLRDLNRKGRLIIVMGSAGERDREKRPIQGSVAARLADYAVFTTEDPRFEDAATIIEEIAVGAERAGARRNRDFACIVDRREAIAHALAAARPGDCVLLAGKGHERSIIWNKEKRPWDEAAVATELLQELGFQDRS